MAPRSKGGAGSASVTVYAPGIEEARRRSCRRRRWSRRRHRENEKEPGAPSGLVCFSTMSLASFVFVKVQVTSSVAATRIVAVRLCEIDRRVGVVTRDIGQLPASGEGVLADSVRPRVDPVEDLAVRERRVGIVIEAEAPAAIDVLGEAEVLGVVWDGVLDDGHRSRRCRSSRGRNRTATASTDWEARVSARKVVKQLSPEAERGRGSRPASKNVPGPNVPAGRSRPSNGQGATASAPFVMPQASSPDAVPHSTPVATVWSVPFTSPPVPTHL
ncbi:MAG: hypothetical protein KatS3mg065_1203 [Chloroflexota bacterium]|nr:MAG: hypothetical protein KatS3mg065_1203 [Chloroflexota bacterium]